MAKDPERVQKRAAEAAKLGITEDELRRQPPLTPPPPTASVGAQPRMPVVGVHRTGAVALGFGHG